MFFFFSRNYFSFNTVAQVVLMCQRKKSKLERSSTIFFHRRWKVLLLMLLLTFKKCIFSRLFLLRCPVFVCQELTVIMLYKVVFIRIEMLCICTVRKSIFLEYQIKKINNKTSFFDVGLDLTYELWFFFFSFCPHHCPYTKTRYIGCYPWVSLRFQSLFQEGLGHKNITKKEKHLNR